MRKLFTLLGAAAMALLMMTSCEKKGKEPDEIVSKISVAPTELSFSAKSETKSVSVSSNVAWTASSTESWVKLGATGGSGDTSLNISIDENSSTAQRSATVTFKTKDGKATANLTVNQDAASTLLSVSPSELSFSAKGESKSVNLKSNTSWKASSSESWATIDKSSGRGDETIGISAAENTGTTSRTATVTFITDDGKSTATVKLTQEGADVVFSIDRSEVNVAAEGGEFTIKVTSNIGYKIDSKPEWVEQKSKSTSGNVDTYTYSAKANTASSVREGTIVFCNDNEVCIPVTVKQAAADASLSVSPAELSFSAKGESKSVSLKSNTSWKASSSESWATIDKSSGRGDETIGISAAENTGTTSRTATVTFITDDGKSTATVKLTQEGADVVFSIDRSEVNVAAEGGEFTIKVTSNIGYKIDSKPEWVEQKSKSTSGNVDTYTYSAKANTASSVREGTIVFCNDNEVCIPVTVKQAAADASLSVSPAELSFSAKGESKSVSLKSNTSWKASSSESWATIDKSSGRGDETIGISAAENTGTTSRTATVTFITDDGKSTATVKLTQEGADVVFSIDRSEVNVAAEGGEFTIKVTSNIGYKIDSKPEWVEQKSKSTSGNVDTYTYSAKANTASSVREGTIVFCNDNEVCIPVTVKQAAGKADDEEDSSSWAGKDFYHKSLGMRFTATWCGYCPIMAESYKLAQSKYPDKIELLNLHASSSNLAFSGTATLASVFNVTGYPTGIVDYRKLIENYNSEYASTLIVNAVKETEANYPTRSGISFTSSVSGTKLSVDVKLYIKEKGDYKLAVVLLEDGIVGYQNGGGNNYHHDGIARLAVSDIKGDAFSTSSDNKTVSKQYSATLSSGWDKGNLRVLVYVLKSYGSRSVISSGSYGNYYVDNAASAAVGTELKLTFTDGSSLSGGNEDTIDGGEIILN
ncbi:MAG: BACON domain-containing carbohydrate-binding protein [Bacteroidia bacterium]|nr:BACON domain-containing carbohydrate-binding protein [Bacteroidia bacterium]